MEKILGKKKRILTFLCVFTISLGSQFTIKSVNAEGTQNQEMYRLYNPYSGEHFYTANADEKNTLAKLGWFDEGIGWYAPSISNTPVYRLYNKYGGEHHYTVNEKERDALVKAGWKDEGIGWYSDDNKTVVLYREYNPNARSCNHNYTANQKEHESLIGKGWKDEGTAWYGASEGTPISAKNGCEESERKRKYSESERTEWGFDTIPNKVKDIDEFTELLTNLPGYGKPYNFGTSDALKAAELAGTDPVLAYLPCAGFEDEYGRRAEVSCVTDLWNAYVGSSGQEMNVYWFPARFGVDEDKRIDDFVFHSGWFYEDVMRKSPYGRYGTDVVYMFDNESMCDIPLYQVMWYAVEKDCPYYDAVLGKVVDPKDIN